jgi:hypothetical protein
MSDRLTRLFFMSHCTSTDILSKIFFTCILSCGFTFCTLTWVESRVELCSLFDHYHKFVIKDCHALLSTMHHLSAPLPVRWSHPTTISSSYEPQSRGNSETCVKVQTSVESEQTCLILPPNKEHNSTLDSTQVNVQKVNPQDNMHVKKIFDNISVEVQCDNHLTGRGADKWCIVDSRAWQSLITNLW